MILALAAAGCGSSSSGESSEDWVSASSNLWSGVKLHFGPNKAYAFEVLGGNENYAGPSGPIRGVKVRYPDGSEEWKNRSYIVGSDDYWIKSDDPALAAQQWQVLQN